MFGLMPIRRGQLDIGHLFESGRQIGPSQTPCMDQVMQGTDEQRVLTTNSLSRCVCVLDWVGAGRGPPIVAAVLAVTGGESTRTLQYNRSGNKS